MRVLTSLASVRLRHTPPKHILDLCTGPGIGALHLSRLFPDADVVGVDINAKALVLARFNAPGVRFICSDGLLQYDGAPLDVVAIHPPFIANDARIYAAGGPTGVELTLRLIGEALNKLRAGGELWSYTAVPIGFDGTDACKRVRHLVASLLTQNDAGYSPRSTGEGLSVAYCALRACGRRHIWRRDGKRRDLPSYGFPSSNRVGFSQGLVIL